MINKHTQYQITEYTSMMPVPESFQAQTLAQDTEIRGFLESLMPVVDSPLNELPSISLQTVVVRFSTNTLMDFIKGIIDGDNRHSTAIGILRNGAFVMLHRDLSMGDTVHGYAPIKHMLQDEVEEAQKVSSALIKQPDTIVLALGEAAVRMEQSITAEEEAHTAINELLADIPVIDTVGIDRDQPEQSS